MTPTCGTDCGHSVVAADPIAPGAGADCAHLVAIAPIAPVSGTDGAHLVADAPIAVGSVCVSSRSGAFELVQFSSVFLSGRPTRRLMVYTFEFLSRVPRRMRLRFCVQTSNSSLFTKLQPRCWHPFAVSPRAHGHPRTWRPDVVLDSRAFIVWLLDTGHCSLWNLLFFSSRRRLSLWNPPAQIARAHPMGVGRATPPLFRRLGRPVYDRGPVHG